MKKTQFLSSQYSSGEEESESSDDEIPNRNVNPQIKRNEYSLFLARRSKELSNAFPSDSSSNSPILESSKSKSRNPNHPNSIVHNSGDESDDINPQIKKSKQKITHSSHKSTLKVNLNFPQIPKDRRQKLLLENIKLIYDFFDHKIPIKSIICAIHDHGGLIREAVQCLNKHPTKYDDYSLAEFPSVPNQQLVHSYLRIMT